MDALFAVQSLLHCLAVFGSAIADCDQAISPTNAAHKAAVRFHRTFLREDTAQRLRGSVSGKELPRRKAANSGAALTGSSGMFSFCSKLVNTNREHSDKENGDPEGPPSTVTGCARPLVGGEGR